MPCERKRRGIKPLRTGTNVPGALKSHTRGLPTGSFFASEPAGSVFRSGARCQQRKAQYMVVFKEWVAEHQKVVAVAKDNDEKRQKGPERPIVQRGHTAQ